MYVAKLKLWLLAVLAAGGFRGSALLIGAGDRQFYFLLPHQFIADSEQFEHRDNPEVFEDYVTGRARRQEFLGVVRRWTDLLEAMYASSMPDAVKRSRKAEMFAAMRTEYRRLESGWEAEEGRRPSFGGFFDEDLNNARLVTVSEYQNWVDAFRSLLVEVDGELPAFYARCRELAELEPALRRERLESL